MHIIRNEQDLDIFLEEICQKEPEGGYWEDKDKIIFYPKGEWFDKAIISALTIFASSPPVNYQYSTKIEPEDKPYIKNTLSYIRNNFEHIYQVMLETLIPFIREWEDMENCKTHELVTTIRQLHEAREKDEIMDGMDAGSLNLLQLNCAYQKDGMVFYSFIFSPDCTVYGYDDGFEVVFWKDHVVYFTDGNMGEAILDFMHCEDSDTYFGIP
uniref:hypothetical protein n=1 Tax=Agathobacter sp. TaxID=2021311 RepID=UPI0040564BE6